MHHSYKTAKIDLFGSMKFSYERSYGLALITECDKIRLFWIIFSLMNDLCKVAALDIWHECVAYFGVHSYPFSFKSNAQFLNGVRYTDRENCRILRRTEKSEISTKS